MALTCPNCGDEIPESTFGVRDAVEDGLTDEIVAHTHDTDGLAVSQTEYYCDPACFVAEYAPEVEAE